MKTFFLSTITSILFLSSCINFGYTQTLNDAFKNKTNINPNLEINRSSIPVLKNSKEKNTIPLKDGLTNSPVGEYRKIPALDIQCPGDVSYVLIEEGNSIPPIYIIPDVQDGGKRDHLEWNFLNQKSEAKTLKVHCVYKKNNKPDMEMVYQIDKNIHFCAKDNQLFGCVKNKPSFKKN